MDGNLGYIVAAYGLVWGALGLYTLRRWRRLGALARAVGAGTRPDA
jgi:hypothetical protein